MRPRHAVRPAFARVSVLTLAAAALASCGGSPSPRSQAPVPPSGAPTAAPAASKAVVGVVLMQQDQFFRMNEAGMRDAAAARGLDLRVQDALGALDKEATLVDTFVAEHVGAIVVSPLSAQGSQPALQRAHDAGVRVVTYNNALGADFPDFSIASDQASLGALTGAAVRTWLDAHRGGRARVAMIGFASQLPEQGGARRDGFKSVVASLPGVTIVAEQDAWEAAQATNAVGEILAKKPDVIWAANEGGTVGAVTAVRNAGLKGKVVVFGTDISLQLADFLLDPDDVLQAVTAQAPFDMGHAAVDAAADLLAGKPVSRKVVLPGRLFSRDHPDEVKAERARMEAAAR